jgi:hypothetical protein
LTAEVNQAGRDEKGEVAFASIGNGVLLYKHAICSTVD